MPRGARSGPRIVSGVAVAVVVAELTAAVVLDGRTTGPAGAGPDAAGFVLAVLVSAAVGALIVHRRPSQPIGWLLLLNGITLGLSTASDAYAAYAYSRPGPQPLDRFAAVWHTHGWPLLFAWIVAIAFVFPDGRLLTRRWRWAARLGVVSFTVTTVGGLLDGEALDAPFQRVPPLAVLPDPLSEALAALGLLGMIATLILAMGALVLRFRRSAGLERLQLKWVALSGVLIPVAILCGTVDGYVRDAPGPLTTIPSGLVLVAVPLTIGFAVLRYRLYDVDRVISATVLYTVLTVLLGAAFLVIVVAGGVALGRGSPVPTAAATATVMLAFRPLRRRLQGQVDRRFHRSRYDARHALDSFLDDLRAGRAAPEQVDAALAAAVGDPGLGVYFWFADQGGHVDASGAPVDPLPDRPGRVPVLRGAELLATVVSDAAAGARAAVLGEVVQRAGLAIEVARLRVEVRRQLKEVEASRARIVTAAQEERRRLERDLHDGAQQRLISIGLDLRHLQQNMPPGTVRAGLDAAVAELRGAVGDLRTLAQGVRPNALDAGLAPALAQLAARTAIRTQVDVTPERFPEPVEAAAYFVASEALTNAVKHSGASVVTVTAAREADQLRVVVHDDGAGGAVAGPGSGLTGLADRVAAVGGRLAVASRPGTGTRLEAVFPCASR